MPFEFCLRTAQVYFGVFIIVNGLDLLSFPLLRTINPFELVVPYSFILYQAQALSRSSTIRKKASLKILSIYSRTMKTCVLLMLVIPIPFNSCDVRDEEQRRESEEKSSSDKKNRTHTLESLTHDYSARAHTHNHTQHIAIPSILMYVYVIVSVLELTISVCAKKRQKIHSSSSSSNRMKRLYVCVRTRECTNQAAVIL